MPRRTVSIIHRNGNPGSRRIPRRSITFLPNQTPGLRACLQGLARKNPAVKPKFRTGGGEHWIARIAQSLHGVLDNGALGDSRSLVNLSHARKAPSNPAERIECENPCGATVGRFSIDARSGTHSGKAGDLSEEISVVIELMSHEFHLHPPIMIALCSKLYHSFSYCEFRSKPYRFFISLVRSSLVLSVGSH